MRILLKCPTRNRPQKIMSTLREYMRLANHPEQLGVAISCDEDDTSMSRNLVQEELHRILNKTAWHRIFMGSNKSKIEACNANMGEIDWEWVPIDEDGNEVAKGEHRYYTMKKGPRDTHQVDMEGMQKVQARITNGFRLFGKYYENLWD